jgi:hypothetical protein
MGVVVDGDLRVVEVHDVLQRGADRIVRAGRADLPFRQEGDGLGRRDDLIAQSFNFRDGCLIGIGDRLAIVPAAVADGVPQVREGLQFVTLCGRQTFGAARSASRTITAAVATRMLAAPAASRAARLASRRRLSRTARPTAAPTRASRAARISRTDRSSPSGRSTGMMTSSRSNGLSQPRSPEHSGRECAGNRYRGPACPGRKSSR